MTREAARADGALAPMAPAGAWPAGAWPTDPARLIESLATLSGHVHDSCDWSHSVQAMLARAGTVTGTSRAWIFQTLDVTRAEVVQDHIFEWAAHPAVAQYDLMRFRLFRTSMEDPAYRALVEARQRGDGAAWLTTDLAPGHLRDDMDSQSITAMLTVPIMVDGAWWGTLGLDDCVRRVRWSTEELRFLRTVADLIAAVVYRQRLADRTRQLAILDEVAHTGVWDWSFGPGRLWCSDSVYRLLGYPPPFPRLPLRPLLRHLPHGHREALMDRLRRMLAGTANSFRLDVEVHTRTGQAAWWEIRADARRDGAGTLRNISGLVLEIGSRKRVEASLRDAADTDPLTGVLNRRGLEAEGARLLGRTRHREELHLLALDIDHFKQVNDTHGHAVGDHALTTFAERVHNQLREGDLLARIGGEEFAILLRGGSAASREVAERIRRAVAAAPVAVASPDGAGQSLRLTTSIGIATLVAGESLPSALRRADAALYAAKRAGRNRVAQAEFPARTGAS